MVEEKPVVTAEILTAGLRNIAGGQREWPMPRCQERSQGLCNQPAGFVAFVGDGHVVVCWKCSGLYATIDTIEFPRDLDILVGNMRDQARNALDGFLVPE